MSKRLFVGGLAYSITNSQLADIFSKFGPVVSCNIISDKFTGTSRGFGFVEMDNEDEADKAIEALNGTELEGRKIIVNVARPLEERPQRTFDSRRGSGRGEFRRSDNNRRGRGRRDFNGNKHHKSVR